MKPTKLLVSCGLSAMLFSTGFTNPPLDKTVKIGEQIWMAENLNVSVFRNGDLVPEAKTDYEWKKAFDDGTPAWCYYNNDPENAKKYGKLYNWFAINDYRGLAPKDWHIPTNDEWKTLADYLGGDAVAGRKLSAVNEYGGTNESGFNGKPSGIRIYDKRFDLLDLGTFWWSSTKGENVRKTWCCSLNFACELERDLAFWGSGFSVRCIKDVDDRVPIKSTPKSETRKFTDPRDGGSTYHTIKINNQVWMSENLDVSTFLNGDVIAEAKTVEEWKKAGAEKTPAWCYYDNASKNDEYGKLYNWYAVNDSRGLAPKGWHIPSDAEWTVLASFLGGDKAGNKLKSIGSWGANVKSNNESGFAALPGGCRINLGTFHNLGTYTGWWSSTSSQPDGAWQRALYNNNKVASEFFREEAYKASGLSVRCIKD